MGFNRNNCTDLRKQECQMHITDFIVFPRRAYNKEIQTCCPVDQCQEFHCQSPSTSPRRLHTPGQHKQLKMKACGHKPSIHFPSQNVVKNPQSSQIHEFWKTD
eukprot:3262539-Amphidinium_carterae.1